MADIVLETFGGGLSFRWSYLICMLNTRSRNYAWKCVQRLAAPSNPQFCIQWNWRFI